MATLLPHQWVSGTTNPDTNLLGLAAHTWRVQNGLTSYGISNPGSDDSTIRFEVRSGDRWVNDTSDKERSEIADTTIYPQGTTIYAVYDFLAEAGALNNPQWQIVGQFHHETDDWSPPFEIDWRNDKMSVTINKAGAGTQDFTKYFTVYTDPVALNRNQTYHMYVAATFHPTAGHCAVWRDGVKLFEYFGPFGWSAMGGCYWKQGIYRASSATTLAVRYSRLWIGTTDPGPGGPVQATRTVGPGGTYSTLQAAVAAAANGDIIAANPAGNPYVLTQDGNPALNAITVTKNLAFVSTVPGTMVKCVSQGWVSNEKALFLIQATVSFNWYDFTDVFSYINNICAIRFESGNLALTNCHIHDYPGNGMLLSPLVDDGTSGVITIDKCEFDHLGYGDGLTHLLYTGRVKSLTVTNSFFHDINEGGGNLLKSRAKTTTIDNNRIFSNLSGANWQIDLSNGGVCRVTNNIIQQSAADLNNNMISMDPEREINPPSWATSSGYFDNNVFINDLDHGALYFNPYNVPTTWTNNKVWAANSLALPPGMVATTVLPTRPVLDQSHPWLATAPPPTPQNYSAGIAENANLTDHPSGISNSNQTAVSEHVTAVDAWSSRATFGSGIAEARTIQELVLGGGALLAPSAITEALSPVDALSNIYTPATPPGSTIPPPTSPSLPPSGSPDGTPTRRSTSVLAEDRSVAAPDPGSRLVFSVKRS